MVVRWCVSRLTLAERRGTTWLDKLKEMSDAVINITWKFKDLSSEYAAVTENVPVATTC